MSDQWQAVPAGDGRVYYWNPTTNATTWDPPPGFNAASSPSPTSMARPGAVSPVQGGFQPVPSHNGMMNSNAAAATNNRTSQTATLKRMCDKCNANKAAAKVQVDGVVKMLCKPCVELEQRATEAAAAQAAAASQANAAAPKIKIGTYKGPQDDKKEKAILEREWGLDKKKDKSLSVAEKKQKLETQLAELDQAIASERKKKDGMDQLVGFYAKDPKQQKEVIAEIADLVKLIQAAQEHRILVSSQLTQCQAGVDPLVGKKGPVGGGQSNLQLPSAASLYKPVSKKNPALSKTWGMRAVAPNLTTDQQKLDALYAQLDELESAIATEVKGRAGLHTLAEQYRSSNPAQFQEISAELRGIDEDIKRLENEANIVQGDVAIIQSPWKETVAPDGRKYYYHAETGETTWETPAELKREKRKCENCDERARVKVVGGDGVARWLCKAHAPIGGALPRGASGSLPPIAASAVPKHMNGATSPRPRSASSGNFPGAPGPAPPPASPRSGGFAPPPAGGFVPPPASFAPPPAAGFAPPPGAGRFAPPPAAGGFAPPPAGFAPPHASPGFGAPPQPAGVPGRPMLNRGLSTGELLNPAASPPRAPIGGSFQAPPNGQRTSGHTPGRSPSPMGTPPGRAGPQPGFAPPPATFAPPPAMMGGGGGGGGGGGSDPNVIGYARVHTRFVPEGEGELGLDVGQVVCVLQRDDDGWWKGYLKGITPMRKGFYPGSFCTEIPNPGN